MRRYPLVLGWSQAAHHASKLSTRNWLPWPVNSNLWNEISLTSRIQRFLHGMSYSRFLSTNQTSLSTSNSNPVLNSNSGAMHSLPPYLIDYCRTAYLPYCRTAYLQLAQPPLSPESTICKRLRRLCEV